jgi:branched-chain amino acid transport system ATP-binding protein
VSAPAAEARPAGAAPAGEPLLRVHGLRCAFGQAEVLHGVHLEVHPGEIVSLIGANGAGKSTTLMCVSRIHRSQGRIEFAGEDVARLAPEQVVRRGLVQVPEGRRIFPRLTVRENLEMGAFIRADRDGIAQDMERVFGIFPILKERAGQQGGTLSGGEQQMLAIGRALMSRPRMLMMDEPSMGIAPMLVAKIFDTVRNVLRAQGMTILLVEQNANAALRMSDRAYVLETGNIVLSGTGDELLRDPRVRAAYLGH